VPNMVINGKVVGDIYASVQVELAPKSRVKGSAYYNLIEMAVGAEVNGGLVHCPKDVQPHRALEDKSAELTCSENDELTDVEVKQ